MMLLFTLSNAEWLVILLALLLKAGFWVGVVVTGIWIYNRFIKKEKAPSSED